MFPIQNRATYATPYVEIGFSLLSFLDITYMYCFSDNRSLNQMRGSQLNLQVSIPILK